MRHVILGSTAFVCLATFAAKPALAIPQLVVTANHLGGGLVQYTLQIDNTDPGGNVAVRISVTGNIHQFPSVFLPDAFPNGGVDLQTEADLSDMFDAGYQALGGKAADSWWDDTVYTIPSPPFGGALGGAVGSTLFQYSADTFVLVGPSVTQLGQIVISDLAAAALPLGPVAVIPGGLAQLHVIDPVPGTIFDSVVVANAQFHSIVGSFGVVPEPNALVLAAFGLLAVAAHPRRRRRMSQELPCTGASREPQAMLHQEWTR